ncbi:lactonase family protein [Streptomonospora wellingtoniae]|uniref:Lactonase family protein n=1 Tax=Streptomonospora wellingtoniae TaxID=3075544 RepID=A0ABU2KXZ7_9ACTN|nr:lactonase family protein [Streptomonospora sp. DSM 45055]MDT0304076.1 lactonase family protein [Streptomonospora sp. DSM 45055]
MTASRLLWIGTYTPDSDPEATGAGIHRALLDPATGALSGGEPAVRTTAPSFLAAHPGGEVLYAVSECERGAVGAFAVSGGADERGIPGLTGIGGAPTGGGSPCHVLVHPEGRHVVAANYADGRVSVHPLDGAGALREAVAVLEHTGHGPNPARQEGPHAHSSAIAPGGRHLLVADLGTDELRCYPFDARSADPVGPLSVAARLTPGAGPRHMAVHPDGHIYVAAELDSRVHVLSCDPERARAVPVADAAASGHEGPNHPGEIALSPDGRLVYVSNRGADTIATFEITGGGTGLRRIAETPCGGVWPRHFALTDGHIVVANQKSAELSTLRLDAHGVPADTGHRLAVGAPACVLPA